MDPTVPKGAAILLDFIGSIEAPKGYDTLYGNAQRKYDWRLTDLTVGQVLAKGRDWPKAHGSSACGRYQFMAGPGHTLVNLILELGVRDAQVFDANLQDRLAYHLLRRRGYDSFINGTLSRTAFGKRLAQEWASLPVLAATKGARRMVVRGQSYYAGDGINRSLTKPERVEAVITAAYAAAQGRSVAPYLQSEAAAANKAAGRQALGASGGVVAAGSGAAFGSLDPSTFDASAWLFVGGLAAAAIAFVVYLFWRATVNRKRAIAFEGFAKGAAT